MSCIDNAFQIHHMSKPANHGPITDDKGVLLQSKISKSDTLSALNKNNE